MSIITEFEEHLKKTIVQLTALEQRVEFLEKELQIANTAIAATASQEAGGVGGQSGQ